MSTRPRATPRTILTAQARKPGHQANDGWLRRFAHLISFITPENLSHDSCISPTQSDCEDAAERKEQFACERRSALLECGVLVWSHCCEFAIAHRPGTSRSRTAVEKR